MFKIAVLISGSGSNLQAIIDSIEAGHMNCQIEAVISDKPGVYGLERAEKSGIKTYVLDRKLHKGNLSDEVLKIIHGKVDLIVLAGFLSILQGDIVKEFKNRIINIHPSLIPAFCGNGMYGLKVHEAAVEYGVKYSGCTVHLVDEGTDTGAIILQKIVEVAEEDTAELLQKKILEKEHEAIAEAVGYFVEDKINISGRKVTIRR